MDFFMQNSLFYFISVVKSTLLRYLIQILAFEVAFIKTQKIKYPVLNIWCSEVCLTSRTPNPLAKSLKFADKT